MAIDRNTPEKYKLEYGVQLRRLADFFAQTSATKEAMGGGISVVAPGEVVTAHVNKPNVEELFVVMKGELRFTLEDDTQILRQGDFGFAPIGQRHEFGNDSADTAELLSIWWRSVEASARVGSDA